MQLCTAHRNPESADQKEGVVADHAGEVKIFREHKADQNSYRPVPSLRRDRRTALLFFAVGMRDAATKSESAPVPTANVHQQNNSHQRQERKPQHGAVAATYYH